MEYFQDTFNGQMYWWAIDHEDPNCGECSYGPYDSEEQARKEAPADRAMKLQRESNQKD